MRVIASVIALIALCAAVGAVDIYPVDGFGIAVDEADLGGRVEFCSKNSNFGEFFRAVVITPHFSGVITDKRVLRSLEHSGYGGIWADYYGPNGERIESIWLMMNQPGR